MASAVGALLALILSLQNQNRTLGMGLACLLAILLFVFFGYRYAAKTRKFMPAGLLSVVSLVVLVISILALQ